MNIYKQLVISALATNLSVSFLLLCFPCFSVFLLLCFCAFLLYYSTFSFLQSCVIAALLPAPLSLLPLVFLFHVALFSPFCILNEINETLKTLGETQRTPKDILVRTPDKKPRMKP